MSRDMNTIYGKGWSVKRWSRKRGFAGVAAAKPSISWLLTSENPPHLLELSNYFFICYGIPNNQYTSLFWIAIQESKITTIKFNQRQPRKSLPDYFYYPTLMNVIMSQPKYRRHKFLAMYCHSWKLFQDKRGLSHFKNAIKVLFIEHQGEELYKLIRYQSTSRKVCLRIYETFSRRRN